VSEDRIISGEFSAETDREEATLRPRLLDQFLGQAQIKENLRVFIKAAMDRRESLDHVIFSAPGLSERFFIDEIHRLKPVIEEMLYTAMEDFEIDVVMGSGPGARTIKIPLPPFTLVGATTKTGLVSSPLYSRFGITTRLDFYTEEDIQAIIRRSAGILRIQLDEEACTLVAHRARHSTRGQMPAAACDYAQVWGGVVGREIVNRGVSLMIDALGLDKLDARSEDHHRAYEGGPVAQTWPFHRGVGGHPGGRVRALPDPARPAAAHPAGADGHAAGLRAPGAGQARA
jgi:Holliday junction DNA helicase RuvB